MTKPASLPGNAIALIGSGPNRVQVNDFDGGFSTASRVNDPTSLNISASLTRGRRSERKSLNVLTSTLTAVSRLVEETASAEDHRGDDAFIRFRDGSERYVQIVVVPVDRKFGAAAARGPLEMQLSDQLAALWIRSAIEHKLSILRPDRNRLLLKLDARHAGILSDRAAADELDRTGDPLSSYGFGEIWLIGPTVNRPGF